MSLGVHLGREVAPLLVYHVAVFRQQRHRLNGECQHGLGAFLVKPFHKTLLQPVQPVPVGTAAIGEAELAEQAFEIRAVIIGYVPEHGLIVSRARGLVD